VHVTTAVSWETVLHLATKVSPAEGGGDNDDLDEKLMYKAMTPLRLLVRLTATVSTVLDSLHDGLTCAAKCLE
jgi:hypothetical protein